MNNQVLQIGSQIIQDEELLPLLKKNLMFSQFVREIIIDQAIADITCTQEEEELAKKQFTQRYQINSEDKLHEWLQQNSLEIEQINAIATRGIKIEKFKKEQWTSHIKSYFLKRKPQLDRIIYSLIRVSDSGIAQELYFRILEGEQTFAQVAKEYAQGSESQTGGLIGPVELCVPHPAISQRLRNAKIGKVCSPLRIQQWWIILRLERFMPAELNEEMEQKLLNELFLNWLNQEAEKQVSCLNNEDEDEATENIKKSTQDYN